MERRTPVWEAPAEIIELMGDVSGNDLNGWGESEIRQPNLVMWANPALLAHGGVQQRMTEEFLDHDVLHSVLRMDDRHDPAPIADEIVDWSPEEWRRAVTEHATRDADPDDGPPGLGVELIGITRPRREWYFEGRSADWSTMIVLGVAMDHEQLATAPEYTSAMEVHRQYNRGTVAARSLADWIRARGVDAVGHGGPGAGPIQMLPAALAAGFGELGKHGSIINRRYGSSFRLAAVLTDAPIAASSPDTFGADEFCQGCRVCTDACPPDAIAPTKRLVRGTVKWAVDFDRCLPYFASSFGCGICIAVCPWSKPDAAPRLADNMERKSAKRSGRRSGPG
jgi:NAD-dependent dihydropyrimidine dehydrogenase PreA subunit